MTTWIVPDIDGRHPLGRCSADMFGERAKKVCVNRLQEEARRRVEL